MIHHAGLLAALWLAPATEDDPIPGLLAEISPRRLRESVETLVGFHNRNTMSGTESNTRGIGAARRWIEAQFREVSAASGGRLEVHTHRFPARMGPRNDRREVEVVNVYGFLPGTQGDPKGRTYVVSGHYDSIASDRWDTESFAPGADDDASGTAVVLELARVLSRQQFEANLIFVCVAGEEQGLYGSREFAAFTRDEGLQIDGMITNDIVGGIEGGNGVTDEVTVRCFSDADGLHSPSRELARTLKEAAARYVPDAAVKLIFRLDRFGRGGDHAPFHEQGVPAVRLTEANENYARQHKNVGTEDGVAHGDLPEHVSDRYMARVARVNAAVLTQLALAPAPPGALQMRAAVSYDTRLSWEPSPSAGTAGYVVVWRETTAPEWEGRLETSDTSIVLEGRTADNLFFGVRARDAWGHESRTVYPDRP